MDKDGPPSLSMAQAKDDRTIPLPPVAQTPEKPAKKPTRQWAAWTRQEEENFFTALRQVGKNFEKITSRVQSKNKEQVRHYYYRLVRRMKKLLGPGFGLDARNSKETIAAMLRWWSLLEKHSCTASKLHLKPRRFKTFIEALAHQLLKDRNKTRRRRSTQGEAFLPATPATSSVLGRGLGSDSHPVKLYLVDGQNNRKVGPKGTRIGSNDSYNRGSLTNLKAMKQRRRPGLVASTAYKRWEKAAMAGVSMVADAAECLERSTIDENSPYDHVTANVLSANNCYTHFQEGSCRAGIVGEATPSANFGENHTQIIANIQPLVKLKLQLFPLDFTRKALEKDEYNPYLELALSTRKKITSVIDHLNRKWGNSSIASGELTLLPYNMHPEDVSCSQSWTQKDTHATAADIFITVGSPSTFRLRYAWLSNCDSRIIQLSASHDCLDYHFKSSNDQVPAPVSASNVDFEDGDRRKEESPIMVEETIALPSDHIDSIILTSEEPETLPTFPQDALSPDIHNENDNMKQKKDCKAKSHGSHSMLSAGQWADSLTNISVGELLSEASRDTFSFRNGPVDNATQLLPRMSISNDSFDAVIAAHLQGFKNQQSTLPTDSHQSIWDAEETCDEFSFSLLRSQHADVPGNSTMESHGRATGANSTSYLGLPEDDAEPIDGYQSDGDEELKDISQSNEDHTYNSSENNFGLADISWLDSLGALDLDVPPPRYVNQDMLSGDCNSLDGLNRFTANSLDAFQSCLFFSSLDRKEIGGG